MLSAQKSHSISSAAALLTALWLLVFAPLHGQGYVVDLTFNGGVSGLTTSDEIEDIALQNDGKILIGGSFSLYGGADCPDRLIRLNSDGAWDNTFNAGGSGFNGAVQDIEIQSDGKILVGGNFTQYNGVSAPYLARLNSDGTRDENFNATSPGVYRAGFDERITKAIELPDQKIIVCGMFQNYNGENCPDCFLRLNSDGTRDGAYNPGDATGFGGTIAFNCAVQPDGKYLVAGQITNYKGADCPDGLARLNSDGSLDNTFNPGGSGFNSSIQSTMYGLTVLADGKILVGGPYTQYNGANCPTGLTRLTSTGAIDATFNTDAIGTQYFSHKALGDNKILLFIGGLNTYKGVSAPNHIVRVNADASLDIVLGENNMESPNCYRFAEQSDGGYLFAGLFDNFDGTVYHALARMVPARAEIAVSGNGQVIGNGDNTPSVADFTDFGNLDVGASLERTFTIANSGSIALNLSGTPKVAVSGAHPGDFVVTAQPVSPVAAWNGGATFTVRFAPLAGGVRSATLSIANNDSDENPYTSAIGATSAVGNGQIIAVYVENASNRGILYWPYNANDETIGAPGTINLSEGGSLGRGLFRSISPL